MTRPISQMYKTPNPNAHISADRDTMKYRREAIASLPEAQEKRIKEAYAKYMREKKHGQV